MTSGSPEAAPLVAGLRRLWVVTAVELRALARRRAVVAGAVVLPPVVVWVYGVALASFPGLPGLSADPATLGRVTGALFAAAFLAGLVGLFETVAARSGDERAAVAGLPRSVTVVARVATVGCAAAVASISALATLAVGVDVAAPLVAAAVLLLAASVYGLLGVVVATLRPTELEGSLVLVFLADLDNALSSGLFPIDASLSVPWLGTVGVTDLLPLAHANALFTAAVLDGSLPDGHLLPALAWPAALLPVALVAYSRATGGLSAASHTDAAVAEIDRGWSS
ncbi:hypothetical protein RYH80_07765 [Halobaculum sp. MBLA0147]|uniref:hypothetical protein n=1 Tax=Halobaculum sp. MBLA0147 TaxID=3079934 RepID=UPI003524D8FB